MPINTTDLTEIDLEGNGIFDKLMAAGRKHLDEEFNKHRIKGNDYATVLTGLIGAAMQASISYAIEKPLADQRLINLTAELPNIELQDDLTQANINRIDAETVNTEAQLPSINLTDEKIQAEINLLGSQQDKVDQDRDNSVLEGNLISKRIRTECANTENQFEDGEPILGLVGAQRDKIYAEESLINQKTVTESAQTVSDAAGSNSIVGRQLSLYAAQTKGYAVDQRVKIAKLYADAANVQANVSELYLPGTYGFTGSATISALNAATAAAN